MHRLIEHRPPRIAMGFVLIAIAAHVLAPLPLHPALPATAIITAAAGFLIMIRAWWLFRIAATAICPTATSTSLLTHDIYSVSRNPMYLGIILMLAALALALGTAPFYLAVTGFAIVMNQVFCPYEERKALAEFGDRYQAYAQSVRRWL